MTAWDARVRLSVGGGAASFVVEQATSSLAAPQCARGRRVLAPVAPAERQSFVEQLVLKTVSDVSA